MVRAITGVVLAGVVLLCGACSSDDTKTNSTPPGAATGAQSSAKQINKTIDVVDGESTAAITLISMDTATVGGMNTKPQSGTFTVFRLKVEGRTGAFRTGYLLARLRPSAGDFVHVSEGQGGFRSGIEPALKADLLGPGDTVEGNIVFDKKVEPGTSFVWTGGEDKPLGVWEL